MNRINAIRAIRDMLKNDPAILAFFRSYFDADGQYFIGISKTGRDATEYPHISFVLVPQKIKRGSRDWVLVCVLGVNEDRLPDGINSVQTLREAGETPGIQLIEELAELILSKLEKSNVLYQDETEIVRWDGTGTLISDMGMQHPYYEIELQLNMVSEPAL